MTIRGSFGKKLPIRGVLAKNCLLGEFWQKKFPLVLDASPQRFFKNGDRFFFSALCSDGVTSWKNTYFYIGRCYGASNKMNEKEPHQNTLSCNLKSLGMKRSSKSEVRKKSRRIKNFRDQTSTRFLYSQTEKETNGTIDSG